MNSSRVTPLVKKASGFMSSGDFQIMAPNREKEYGQRADTHATVDILSTPRSPAKENLAPPIHLHGEHIGGT